MTKNLKIGISGTHAKAWVVGFGILICALLCFCSSLLVFSQDEIDLGEIVVTATKTEKRIEEVPQTISVITREDIEKSGSKNLGDALRGVLGIDIRSYGPLGALTTTTLRGLSDKQVLFLLDGMPISEAQGGGLDLSLVSLGNVDRIEVLKGPASSLYGANALGGVINIITQKAENKREVKISLGGNNTKKYTTNFGQNLGKIRYLISAEKQSSSGMRENDEYEGDNLQIKIDNTFKNGNFTLSYGKIKSEAGSPGPLTAPTWGPPLPYWPSKLSERQDNNNYFLLGGKIKLSSRQNLSLKLYQNKTLRKYFDEFSDVNWGDFVWISDLSQHQNTQQGLELQNDIKLSSKNLITAGYERQKFENDSNKTGKNKLENSAYYFQIEDKNIKNTLINLGVRQDDHQIWGKKNSTRGSLVFKKDKNTTYRLLYGKAFRAPAFDDLYWPKSAWAEGNPNLKPEEGNTWEFTTEYREEKVALNMSFFRNKMKSKITWAPHPDFNWIWRPSNVDEVEISGLEIELSNKITNNLLANFNFISLDAMDEKKGQKLTYRPDTKFNYELGYLNKNASFAFAGRYTDKRIYRYGAGKPEYLPSYSIYDAKISKDFKIFNISVFAKNLFDKKYQEVYDYPTLGRTFHLEVSYKK